MEVLETKTSLKESETQAPESNYNCRIPRDLNLGANANSKSRGETDVGLLVACKIQLSSEVIRWKTETLRLQKERDLAQLRAKELDQKMAKLADRTKELEDRLMQTEDENKHLKSRSVVIDEEKAALVQKLSQSVNKYHSYPCGDASPKSSRLSRLQASEFRRVELLPNEDWREVSQKMLQQMKQEMRELQEMNNHFCIMDKENSTNLSQETDNDCKDELEDSMSSLLSETESLKHHLLEQRQKLKSLLSVFTSGDSSQTHPNLKPEVRGLNLPSVDMQRSAEKNKSSHPRPSENKYSVYYTNQLETLEDLNRSAKETCSSPRNKICAGSQELPSCFKQNLKPQNPDSPPKNVEMRNESVRDEKVCPICQMNFDATVSQAFFEEHVLNHLETESTSLLDQYVVL